MKSAKLIIAWAVLLFFAVTAQAQQCAPVAQEGETRIYYSNGMTTSKMGAVRNWIEIIDTYDADFKSQFSGQEISICLNYNPTQGEAEDSFEVFAQKADELGLSDEQLSDLAFYRLVYSGHELPELNNTLSSILAGSASLLARNGVTSTALAELRIATRQDQVNLIEKVRNRLPVEDAENVSKYVTDLQNGSRLVVLAHSQGNLVTNRAVDEILARWPSLSTSIKIVSVATPASKVSGVGLAQNKIDYLTATDDLIIQGAREVFPNVLQPQFNNTPVDSVYARNVSNHLLASDYLFEELPSRDVIFDMLVGKIMGLEFPSGDVFAEQVVVFSNQSVGLLEDEILIAYGSELGSHILAYDPETAMGRKLFSDISNVRSV